MARRGLKPTLARSGFAASTTSGGSGPRRLAIGVALLVATLALAIVLRLQLHPPDRKRDWLVRDVRAVPVPDDAASIARGEHVSRAIAVCHLCHGEDLGGKLAFEHPLLGRGWTPNLTGGQGGVAARYDVEDWVRAIRHGVAADGRALLFMPADHYAHLTDRDLGAMIAYYRSLPPVDNKRVRLELTPVARLMIDLGLSGDVVRAGHMDHAAIERSAHAAHEGGGAYLVAIGGCTFCHGEDLRGGQGLEPGAPPGPDITRAGLDGWRFEAFATLMRTGAKPDGGVVDPRFMPWQGYRHLRDEELRTLWKHLRSLPVAAPGG